MKISAQTIGILKNFASINASLLVKAGKVLSTISPQKTILAKAAVAEEFPREFAIYDLGQFLGALSLVQDPEIEFEESHLTIKSGSGKHSIKYFYAKPELVVSPPAKEIPVPNSDIKFKLPWQNLSEIIKAASILQLPEIVVQSSGDGTLTRIGTVDTKNNTSNSLFLDTDHTSSVPFRIIFRAENLKLLQADYEVVLAQKGVGYFTTADVSYFIASESTSTYG